MNAQPTHLVVAICTCNRPLMLADCLVAVGEQVLDRNALHWVGISIEVVVIDNAPRAENAMLIDALKPVFPFPISLVEEPKRGLVEARNRAVARVLAQDAILVFVDDDETPCPQWLDSLRRCQLEYHADIVTGPVLNILPASAPIWLRGVPFYRDRRQATGKRMPLGYTGNMLISLPVLQKITPAFEPIFSFIGGEDEHFSRIALAHGFSIIWCDEALATSPVSLERIRLRWLIRRGFRACSSWSMSLRLRKVPYLPIKIAGFAVLRLLRALTFLAAALVTRSPARFYSGMFYASQAVGTVAGAFGITYHEYAPARYV